MANVQKWSKTTASNATADTDINWAEGQAPSTVNNSARAVMQGLANWRDDTSGQLTLAGGTTVYTLTTNSVSIAQADGFRVHAVVNVANTGASTLNVDGLGAKNIYKATTSGLATLSAGDLVVDMHAIFEYDASLNAAAGGWVLLNPAAGGLADGDKGDITVSGSGATFTIDNNAVTYAKMQDASAGNVVLARAAATSGDYAEVSLAASRLLGRGSTGDIAAISLGTGLSLAGTVLSSSSAILDTQTFTANGTWTKPATGTWALVVGVGAGGGGGGGQSNATAGTGGGGGGAGVAGSYLLRLSDLGATESITIPVGGAAGANGGQALFGNSYAFSGGAQGAGAGSGNGGAGGSGGGGGGGYSTFGGGTGGLGTRLGNAVVGATNVAPGVGGAIGQNGVSAGGGSATYDGSWFYPMFLQQPGGGGGGGGRQASTTLGTGAAGGAGTSWFGAGGAGGNAVNGVGQNGSAGTAPGGGGGGGGSGVTGGSGGAGARGEIRVYVF